MECLSRKTVLVELYEVEEEFEKKFIDLKKSKGFKTEILASYFKKEKYTHIIECIKNID